MCKPKYIRSCLNIIEKIRDGFNLSLTVYRDEFDYFFYTLCKKSMPVKIRFILGNNCA